MDGLSDACVGRAVLLVLVTSVAISCGGSTTAPTAAPQVQLPDGNYALTINSTGSCFQNSSGGAPAVSSTITAAVTLQRSGTSWAVRPNDGGATGLVQPNVTYEAVAGNASTNCLNNVWTLTPR